MRRLSLVSIVLFVATLLAPVAAAGPAGAAAPSSGTITPSGPPVTWSGDETGGTSPNGEATCVDAVNCDAFSLTVGGVTGDWANEAVEVGISWTHPNNDFDVYVHKGDLTGPVVASSGHANTTSEITSFSPSDSGVGVYTVHVVDFTTDGIEHYAGSATAQAAPPVAVAPAAGTARFQSYVAPDGMGNNGEPSIGVDWKTNKTMVEAGFQTLRVSFDDCSSPAKATWEDVSPTFAASLDPIGFVDRDLGRTYACQLLGKAAHTYYSDDDGGSWTPTQGNGINSGVDHQTIGAGPYAPPIVNPAYPHAVYYCSQDIADASCARSDDGGLTYGPAVPIYTLADCGGLHGHVKVAPDGTVYVPNASCTGQGVAVSTDNGLTWTLRRVPGSTDAHWDPSVGIASDGTVYFGYGDGDGHARVAVSHDRGITWSTPADIGAPFGIQNAVFPVAVAGDPGRAAIGFLGTTSTGDSNDPAFVGVWHLYVASTYDGGGHWSTVDVTPTDPVQKGSICQDGPNCPTAPNTRNLLDFNDAAIDKDGRVEIVYADGCVQTCASDPSAPNSETAITTIARQSGGKRMFAANDPVEPAVPGAPLVTGSRTIHGTELSWAAPDDGGSPITGYNVYRSTSAGGPFTNIATVTGTKYLDTSGNPSTDYFYRVTAVNAVGEGASCGTVIAPAAFNGSACQAPGVTVLTDPSGDELDSMTQHDIQSVSFAEPYFGAGVSRLVVTMKVADLSSTPSSNSYWRTFFKAADGYHYVDMETAVGGTVSFTYGPATDNGDGTVSAGAAAGTADASSHYDPDGSITVVIDNSKVGSPAAGTTLTNVFMRVSNGAIVPDNANYGTPSAAIAYTLVGNASCQPQNPPVATLTATPRQGVVPLAVHFDGSTSSDPDGDAIASYTFDFGDGTAPVTQSTASVDHTYTDEGEYNATLHVTDARGATSVNAAAIVIESQGPPDLNLTQSALPSPATVGRDLTYTITVANPDEATATNVKVVDTLPAGVTFTSASPSAGTCAFASGKVTCTAASLAGGASLTDSIVVTPTVAGSVTNTATVTENEADPNAADNSATTTVTVNPPPPTGYWLVAKDGGIFNYGDARFFGSMGSVKLSSPVVAMAARPQHDGYWMVTSAGELFAFGAAQHLGSMTGKPLNSPIVGMASTPSGNGYWFVAADGGIFSFGDAGFLGSMGGKRLNAPIVGMASTPSGTGYWLVASDGGIFNYGDAGFRGSMGGRRLNAPVVGMVGQPGSNGYWLVATDGGVFSFGAPFYGSMGGKPLNQPINAMSTVTSGQGYRFGASDGGVFTFGPDAPFRGSHGGTPVNQPVVGMTGF